MRGLDNKTSIFTISLRRLTRFLLSLGCPLEATGANRIVYSRFLMSVSLWLKRAVDWQTLTAKSLRPSMGRNRVRSEMSEKLR